MNKNLHFNKSPRDSCKHFKFEEPRFKTAGPPTNLAPAAAAKTSVSHRSLLRKHCLPPIIFPSFWQ